MTKEDMRFLTRGKCNVTVEWLLLCFAYNVCKLDHKAKTDRLGTHLIIPMGDRIKFPVISIFRQNSRIHIYHCEYGYSAGNLCNQGNLRIILCDYASLSNITYTNISAVPH